MDLDDRPAVSGDSVCPPSLLDPAVRQALLEAVARLDDAETRGRPQEICLALVPVAACYRAMGAWTAAEHVLRQALRHARTGASPELLVDVLCELAETACSIADSADPMEGSLARAARERARDEAFEAASLAHRSSDGHWEASALLRISDVLNRCGDHDDAACLQSRAVELMSRR
jgi:tetratricopeptide (TPR) repeat protein